MVDNLLRTLFLTCFSIWFFTPVFADEVVELTKIGGLKRGYFLQDKESERISVNLIIHVGEYDLSGVEGLAHYLEHLVYYNADKAHENGSIKERHANAYTGGTYTSYVNNGRADQFENMLRNMAEVFKKPELKTEFAISEIDIIRREYEFRMSDNPRAKIRENLVRKIYGLNSYARSVIGSKEDHDNFTPQLAYAIHEQFYKPSNASLFISGNINKRKVKKLVAKYFNNLGGEQFQKQNIEVSFNAPSSRYVEEIIEEKFNEARLIYLKEFSLPKGKTYEEISVAFDFLSAILNSTLEGGVAKPLRYDDYIVAGYSLYFEQTTSDRAMLSFSARPDNGVDVKTVLEKFEQVIFDIGEDGIPAKTFDRVRKREIANIEEYLDDSGFISGLVMGQILNDKDVISSKQYLTYFKKVSLEDLNEIMKMLAAKNHVAAALAYPKTKE